ncbi:MAG: protein kinase, partial [Chitinivibrionales bacterium]|nr:protein kinase [Chitinivibrionales bacterium]
MKQSNNNPKNSSCSPAASQKNNGSQADPGAQQFWVSELFGRALSEEKYQFCEEIGAGGMGSVHRAVDKDIGRDIAIKTIGSREDKDRHILFVNEARITGRLEHPNIVPVHEFSIDKNGLFYFTMKLVKGKSLKDFLEEYRGDPRRFFAEKPLLHLIDIFLDICNAVSFAHSKGIIHRDLKPSNIMIGDFGEVQVMDWGLAKMISPNDDSSDIEKSLAASKTGFFNLADGFHEHESDGKIWGTIAYMPPEQAKGKIDEIDQRSDIFSLGAILYEMLTLNPPIQGTTPKEMIQKARKAEIIPIDACVPPSWNLPAELTAIATKALALRKADRYQTVENLKNDIDLFLENKPISAKEDSAWETIVKLFRRNRPVSISIGIAFIIILSAGITFTLMNFKERKRAETALRNFTREQKEKLALIQKDLAEREREWVLVFHDDFSDAQFRKRWDVLYGQYKVIDGARQFVAVRPDCKIINGELRIRDGTPQALLLKNSMTGDVAIEFDCRQESMYLNDISCFFDATRSARRKLIPYSGYLLQYGADDNSCIKATRSHVIIHQKFQSPIITGKHYHVRAEKVGNRLRMTVNDTVVIDVTDTEGLYGKDRDAIGILGWGSEMWLDNVKVYSMGTSLKVDALDLAKRQMHRGNYATAGDIYQEIYDGTIDPRRKMAAFHGIEKSEHLMMVQKKLPYYSSLLKKIWPDIHFSLKMVEDGLSFEMKDQAIREKITSLAPLKHMPLSRLDISGWTQIQDLGPLASMELRWLKMNSCRKVTDLSPLRGMPLHFLNINYCRAISSIEPVRDARLNTLLAFGTGIDDLSPLNGMPLSNINIHNCIHITDISPLKGAPLEIVYVKNLPVTDISPVAQPGLRFLDASGTRITSIEPLRSVPLATLKLNECAIDDFSPLSTMSLYHLEVEFTGFNDISRIENMEIANLYLRGTPVSGLAPLKNASLKNLDISYTACKDFQPLLAMGLSTLVMHGLQPDSATCEMISQLPLTELGIDITSSKVLNCIKRSATIEYINGMTKEYVCDIMPLVIKTLEGEKQNAAAYASRALQIKDRYYCAIPAPLGFQEARDFCKKFNACLASPSNRQEYLNLKTRLGRTCSQLAEFFLGLYYDPAAGEMRWDSGKKVEYLEFESTWDRNACRKRGCTRFMP